MKTYKVLLDDFRDPEEVYQQTRQEVYLEDSWLVVRSYEDFTSNISGYYHRGAFPRLVSFDSNIATLHPHREKADDIETFIEKTAVDCARWLAEFITKNRLDIPEVLVHSLSEEATASILAVFASIPAKGKR